MPDTGTVAFSFTCCSWFGPMAQLLWEGRRPGEYALFEGEQEPVNDERRVAGVG